MFNLNIFKKPANPESPEPHPNRCHFQHQNGRRCRLPVADESTQFCGTHRDMLAAAKTKEEQAAEAAAITAEVYGPVKSLDSAVAINHVLGNLFRLNLEGRIPQRKAALLTSMCRTLLKSVECARNEITAAKLFPSNNTELLNLLAAVNGENAESETVAPQSSLHRDREGGRTCAAAFSASKSTSDRELRHSIVAAGLACPEQRRGTGPGFQQSVGYEDHDELRDAINHATVAPQSAAASFPASNSFSSPDSKHRAGVPDAQVASRLEAGNVIWIGHNLLHPNRSSSAFFKQPPVVPPDATRPAATSASAANESSMAPNPSDQSPQMRIADEGR